MRFMRCSKVDAQIFQVAYALAAIPARYTLERRQWAEAAALKVPVEGFPWNKFAYAEAHVYFARSLGASRSGDPAAASTAIERLTAMQKSLAEAKEDYWATQVEIQRLGASAWLAHAEGKRDEALKLMRAAADLEDTTEKHPVTPGAIVPARELLGELLLELREPAASSERVRSFIAGFAESVQWTVWSCESGRRCRRPKQGLDVLCETDRAWRTRRWQPSGTPGREEVSCA